MRSWRLIFAYIVMAGPFSTTITLGASVGPYEISDELTEAGSRAFGSLSDEQKELFLERRTSTLNAFVKILQNSKLHFGFAAFRLASNLAVDTIKFVVKYPAALIKTVLGAKGTITKTKDDPKDMPRSALSRLTKKSAEDVLNGINTFLYENARVVVNSNEVGLSVRLGASTGIGLGEQGDTEGATEFAKRGGLFYYLGLGLNIGVDFTSGHGFFELFQDSDRLEKVHNFLLEVTAGLDIRAFFRENEGPPAMVHHLRTFYKGALGSSFAGEDRAFAGLGYSLAASVPPFIGYIEEFDSRTTRTMLFSSKFDPMSPLKLSTRFDFLRKFFVKGKVGLESDCVHVGMPVVVSEPSSLAQGQKVDQLVP